MAYLSRSNARRPSAMADMNVVPFIDVMLVLLVIFMITAPLLTQGVKVDLPQTKAQALSEQEKEPVIVTVDASGNFYLNLAAKPNQPLPARTLSSMVTQELASSHNDAMQRPVLVRGDKSVNYGKVVEAMVLLQQAGAKTVGLITQPQPERTPS